MKQRLKEILESIAENEEDFGDYSLTKINSDDAYWLVNKVEELEEEKQRLYGKLNEISDIIENGRNEV